MRSAEPEPTDPATEEAHAAVGLRPGVSTSDESTHGDRSSRPPPEAGEATQAHDPARTGTDGRTTQPQSARRSTPRAAPVIRGYEIEGELGRGGMGVVYKARQVLLNRDCALKMILAAEHAGAEAGVRFLAEAEADARLKHPNIVQIYHIDEHDGQPYFEMEYVDGGSLAERLDGAPRPPREAARLVETLARAMAEAHRRGVVHRDLKPGNILLTSDGTPKVADFGLAKLLNVESGLTRTDSILGSPSYMAPEQAEGKAKEIGPAADLYALGAILYELLTGRPPFRGATVLDTLQQVKAAEPVPPSRMVPEVPRDAETIALKCLQKAPGKRYESATALAEDLRRFQAGEPIVARPLGVHERGWRWCRRNPAVAGSLAAAAAALVAAAGLALLYAAQQNRFGREQLAATARIGGLAKALEGEKLNLERSLVESNLRMAALYYARGQAACAKGEIGPGLLWTIECWRSAVEVRDPAWQHAARTNLAAWHRRFPRLEAIFPHASAVSPGCVAFSPDGKTILTGSADGTARLWDAATGQPIGLPLRHQGAVNAVAFSPDGATVLTGSDDGTARLWDYTSGRPADSPMRHPPAVKAVAFSPDGRALLTGGEDRKARLWEVETGQPIGEPLPHGFTVQQVSFSPDGKTLLTGSGDFQARLWDAATGTLKAPLKHDLVTINVATFSPDGRTVLTASGDKTARLWEAATGKPVGSPMRHDASVKVAVFSPDGKTILTGSQDSTARLWDSETSRPISSPLRHDGGVYAAAFSPDGKIALTGSDDRTARLWDTASGRPIGLPLQHHGGVYAVAFSPGGGKTVLTGSMDGTARLWGTASGPPPEITLRHDNRVWAAVFSRDGRRVLTGSMDKTARLSDALTGQLLSTMRHEFTVSVVRLSPDGKTALTLTGIDAQDKTARLWDTTTREPIGRALGNGGGIWDVSFSPDGTSVLTACDDGTARLWVVATGRPRGPPMRHDAAVMAAVFSPDGETILTGSRNRTARLWDAATGQPIGPPLPHRGWVEHVAFGPDGKTAVTSSGEIAQLWNVASGRPIGFPMRHLAGIKDLAINPDGEAVLTASLDGTARLWDAATGRPKGPPMQHQGGLNHVSFSTDGKLAITSSEDWTARLWDVATGQRVGEPLQHRNGVYPVSFSPDGKTVLTGSLDHTVRLWPVEDLPDDPERVATWVESLTALTLDSSGSIQPLDRDAWLERRETVKRRGGPPAADAER